MSNESLKKQILDYINTLDLEELISLHNDYSYNDQSQEEYIYENTKEVLDEELTCYGATAIIDGVLSGKYKKEDKYFQRSFDGKLNSFSNPEDHISSDAIAEYVVAEWDSIGRKEIEDILDCES